MEMEIDIVNLVMLVLFALMVLAMLVQLCLSLKQEYDRKKEKPVDKEKLFSEYLSSIGSVVYAEAQANLAMASAKRIAVNANRAKEELESTVNLQCR